MRQKLLDHPHRPAQVDFYFARHVVQVAGLIELQVAHYPRVVDEGIESGKLREHAGVQRRYRAWIANIALEGMDAGKRPLGGVKLCLVAAGNDDRVASLEKLVRQFKADAACSSSYQDGPLFQFHGETPCVSLIVVASHTLALYTL